MRSQLRCYRRYVTHTCCGMYIPLSDDKHRFVRDSSLCALEIRDNLFPTKFFSQTEFCLGLHTAVVFRMQPFNYIG